MLRERIQRPDATPPEEERSRGHQSDTNDNIILLVMKLLRVQWQMRYQNCIHFHILHYINLL